MSAIIFHTDPFTGSRDAGSAIARQTEGQGRGSHAHGGNRARSPRPSVTPRRAALVIGSVLSAVGVIGAAVKLHALATSLSAPTSLDTPGIAWAGWLLIIPALVAGQMWRGWMHSRGIRKSHFAAIAGKGIALALVVAAVVFVVGGA